MENFINNTIKQIAKSISQYSTSDAGLFTGLGGLALFELYYGEYCDNEESRERGLFRIEKIFDKIDLSDNHSLCTGMTGIAWLLNHMKKNKWEYIDDMDWILYELDSYIMTLLPRYLSINYFDFLYGYVGIGRYLLNRKSVNPQVNDALLSIIDTLEKTAIRENNSIKWKYNESYQSNNMFNLSLAHGMSSIILLLTNMYKLNLNASITLDLIRGSVNYIINQRIDFEKYNSHFPAYSLDSNTDLSGTRLAWCYGDLGICYSLWQAGIYTKNTSWVKESLEIFRHASLYRRDLKRCKINDSCFCHGSIGVAHVFYRLWIHTNEKEFKDAADYWYLVSLNLSRSHITSSAGFLFYNGNKKGYIEQYDLLNGISGIGLSLLHYKFNLIPDYDDCFFLS